MTTYIVNRNAQANGDHEVHDLNTTKGCLPDAANRVRLGDYTLCHTAVSEAERLGYSPANGCYHCANDCHTS